MEIEEFVHTADGKLESVLPWYCREGETFTIPDPKKFEGNCGYPGDGERYIISKHAVEANSKRSKNDNFISVSHKTEQRTIFSIWKADVEHN